MYECSSCSKKFTDEEEAINCCNDYDDEYALSKTAIKPHMRQHHCPNVTHGGKSWMVWLKVDEGCPMCDYVWQPR